MVKNLSCVSCAARNVFPINSLPRGCSKVFQNLGQDLLTIKIQLRFLASQSAPTILVLKTCVGLRP